MPFSSRSHRCADSFFQVCNSDFQLQRNLLQGTPIRLNAPEKRIEFLLVLLEFLSCGNCVGEAVWLFGVSPAHLSNCVDNAHADQESYNERDGLHYDSSKHPALLITGRRTSLVRPSGVRPLGTEILCLKNSGYRGV